MQATANPEIVKIRDEAATQRSFSPAGAPWTSMVTWETLP